MTKRNKPTSEAELQDAVNRIGKKPEAIDKLGNKQAWHDYLINVLHISPETLQGDKNQYGRSGIDFWENVRQGVVVKQEGTIAQKHNVKIEHYGKRTIYRGQSGRFVSRVSLGLPPLSEFRQPKPEPSEHDISLQNAYKSVDRFGRKSYRDSETGRFVKLVRYDDNGEEVEE